MKIVLCHNTARYLALHYRETILALVRRGADVTCVTPPDQSVNMLLELGATHRPWRVSQHGINPLPEYRSFLSLYGILRSLAPDVYFGFSVKPNIYGGMAARTLSIPNRFAMVTGLGSVFVDKGLKVKLLRTLVLFAYRHAFHGATRVFFQNPDDRDIAVHLGLLTPRQAIVIPGTGIDTTEFEPPLHRKTGNTVRFIVVARMLRNKGIEEFVEAARSLGSEYPAAEFQLLGPVDGGPSAIAEQRLRQWDEEGVIRYLSEVEDVRPQLAKADVFVLPSYREGFSRAILEAMAMGKPVITTDVPGCRDAVSDGVNGFLVPIRDSIALARAMERFLLDRALIDQMGSQSRKRAESKYDVRAVTGTIVDTLLSGTASCC